MSLNSWFLARARVSAKRHGRASLDDKMTFFQQFGSLLASGTPMLRAIARAGRLEIVRRDVDAEVRPITVTGPDGAVREVTLEQKRDGLFTGSLPISQSGLYRVTDGERVFMAAAGSLNPIEFADVRATSK